MHQYFSQWKIYFWKFWRTKENVLYAPSSFFSSTFPQVFCMRFERSRKIMQRATNPVHIHTSSWWSGELRINPIALSYFRSLRNRDGYNAVRWRDTDKRLARSRRHHPSVAFTPRAIPRRFTRLIGTAEPARFYLAILSAVVSCKKENEGNQALQFRCRMVASVNNAIMEHYCWIQLDDYVRLMRPTFLYFINFNR